MLEREAPGGQAGQSSRIENYLGFPMGLSGSDLARRATDQARRLGAELLTIQDAVGLRADGAGRTVELSNGATLSCSCVLVASGVSYRKLDAPGFAELTGAGVYYGAALTEARSCSNQEIVIIGGANSAGQAAVYFSGYAKLVTILIRGAGLEKSMSHYLIEQIAALPNVVVRTGTSPVAAEGEDGHLRRVRVRDAEGAESVLHADACFVFIGASPRTDWLEGVVARDDKGFILRAPRSGIAAGRCRATPSCSRRACPASSSRGRARTLDQARGERRRRGLDGRIADPPVPPRAMTDAAEITLAELRRIDLFDDLDDAELARVDPRHARPRPSRRASIVAEQGKPVPGVELLLEGAISTQLVVGDHTEPIGRQEAPTWMGAISVLTEGDLGVRLVSEGCRSGLVLAADFRRLAFTQQSVHRRVMERVAPVMSRITALEQNRERLAALGTMAAGLAHELNNPAAAARRAAAQMAEALEVLSTTIGRFVESGIERHEAAELLALQREAMARAAEQTALSSLDAADAEDALLERLEELEIPDAWKLVEPLVGAGLDADWVGRVAAIAGRGTDGVLRWVAAGLTAQSLASELQESTKRMSSLVGAVKSYAYMDRGDLVEIDLHEGIETTITILGHKLKQTTIEIVRDYDRSLPLLTVRGSELNQVWTNLLDNAIDALGESGTITIATRAEQGRAIVEITDDGPGIPPEAQSRVFDAFFTTKDVGRGTGLGLATVYRIVVDRHAGSLTFTSAPGRRPSASAFPSRRAWGYRLPFPNLLPPEERIAACRSSRVAFEGALGPMSILRGCRRASTSRTGSRCSRRGRLLAPGSTPGASRSRARSARPSPGPGTSSTRFRARPSPGTSTASPNGRSSTRPGPACRSTRCSRASTSAATSSRSGRRAATRPTSRSPTSRAARRGSSTPTRASRSSPSTAARRGCSCPTCTSGRARSGCAA